jgi:hypothetical protein
MRFFLPLFVLIFSFFFLFGSPVSGQSQFQPMNQRQRVAQLRFMRTNPPPRRPSHAPAPSPSQSSELLQLSSPPADGNWRGRVIRGTGGKLRQVNSDGLMMVDGQAMGDGFGNILNVQPDGTINAGSKPWGYVMANGQVRQGLRPAQGVAEPAMGTNMNFRGRSIIGMAGITRQVDQQGRILIEGVGFQQIDGSNLIVETDGRLTVNGNQWGALDSNGQVSKI